MKKTYLIPILVLAVVGLIALRPERQAAPTASPPDTATGVASVPSDNTTTPDVPSSAEESSIAPPPDVTITADGATYPVHVADGASVLDAMRAAAASSSFTFTGRDYPGLGFFVESINGKENTGGFYWILYVNGASSETGASQTRLSNGDAIEWRYKQGY
ncbi:MAG: DUF4430 domain-containing protein [Patescibacteria group bacterium]|nr:DUF4430 domain-containing protein [Patescibacteria group bacterium]